MSFAVAVYILIISIMVWLAILTLSPLLTLAAFLFYISDAMLAIDKFNYRFKFAEHIIMTTYFSAQLLFAVSIVSNLF